MGFFQGGFTKYCAPAGEPARPDGEEPHAVFKEATYIVSYSRGLAQATNGSARPEFKGGPVDNCIWNNPVVFGPHGLDYKHILNGGVAMRTFAGFHLNFTTAFRTPAAASIFVPNISSATSDANGIFSTDEQDRQLGIQSRQLVPQLLAARAGHDDIGQEEADGRLMLAKKL